MTNKKSGRGNGSRAIGGITGGRPAERDLRALEEEWRSLVENIPDIVMTVDADGTILFINRTVPGLTVEKAVGTSVYDFVPPEHHDALRKPLEGVFQSGKAYSYEIAGAGPFGHTSWYFSRIGPIVRDGRVVAAALITTDITERKRAEQALRDSEARFRSTLDGMMEGCLIIGFDWRYLYANDAVARHTRRTKDEILGHTMMEMHPGIENTKEFAYLRRCMEERVPHRTEWEYAYPDGASAWFDVSVEPVPEGVFLLFLNITERKLAEEALRHSEERYRVLVENINEAIYELDAGGRVTYISPVVEEVGGYSPSEMIGRSFTDFLHPDDVSPAMESHRRGISGDPQPDELRFLSKSGEVHWMRSFGRPIREGDRIVGFRGVLTDVTERRQMEEALRDSEERYRAVFEQAADSVVLIDADTAAVVQFNDTAHQVLGYSREELANLKVADLEVIESTDEIAKHIEKVLKEGTDTFETKHRTKGGETLDIEVRCRAISTAGRDFVHAMFRDITERRRAEEALRESEERYRDLVEAAPDVIYALSTDGTITSLNSAFESISGWSCTEWLGKHFARLIHPEDLPAAMEDFRAVMRGEVPPVVEYRMLTRSGRYLTAETVPRPLMADGKVVGTIGIVRDITERKQIEEALRESEANFRALAESASAAVFLSDGERFFYVNPAAEVISGYSQEELLSMEFLHLVHPDLRKDNREHVRARLRGEPTPSPFELKIVTKDGDERWLLATSALACFDGKPMVLGTAFDITERKLAEEALHQSEKRYRQLVEDINDIIYEVDAGGRITYVSPVVEEVGGYSPSEMVGRSWAEFLHPDDHATAIEDFRKNVSGEVEPREYRLVDRSGETHWVRSFGRPIIDAGRVVGMRGVLTIITDRKRAEEGLRESEERWRSLVENAPDIIMTVDADSTILFVNRTVPGLAVGSVVGTSLYDYLPPEHRDRQRRALEEVFETGKPQGYEIAGTGPHGRTSWYLSRIGPVLRGGKVVAAILITTDITEQRRAEEGLRESEERYRDLVELSPDAVVVHSEEKILFVNSAAVQLFGAAAPDQIVGKAIWDFVHPEYVKAVRKRIRSARRAGSKVNLVEEKLVQLDGPVIDVEMVAIPIVYQGKAARQVVLRDVTERKRMEEALHKARDEIESTVEQRMQRGTAYGLSFRELTVLHLLAEGRSDREIGAVLGISTLTAQKHVENIRIKMGASSRTEASVRAVREGLLD